jgi:glycosyltransferase 2 family protein
MTLASIFWTSQYLMMMAVLFSFHIAVNPIDVFLLQWIVFSLMAFIPTPGASGGAEASFYFIFKSFLSPTMIGLVTSVWRILTFYGQLSLGAILFIAIQNLQRFQKKAFSVQTELCDSPAATV